MQPSPLDTMGQLFEERRGSLMLQAPAPAKSPMHLDLSQITGVGLKSSMVDNIELPQSR
jgi:hypothetical protein